MIKIHNKTLWLIGILILALYFCSPSPSPDPDPDPPPPPPPVPTVAQDIQLPQIVSDIGYPVYLQTAFMPEYLVAHKVKDADFEAFLDEFCEREAGNSIRFFLWVNWKWKHTQWMHQPFKKVSGKYDVTGDIAQKINPAYLDLILRRIKMVTERKIFLSLDLIDNCSCHWLPNTSWGNNWLNGDVNNAGTGKSPSDIYDWADNDDITAESQTTTGGTTRFMELDLSAMIPTSASAIYLEGTLDDSGGGNAHFYFHPLESWGAGKQLQFRSQVANIAFYDHF